MDYSFISFCTAGNLSFSFSPSPFSFLFSFPPFLSPLPSSSLPPFLPPSFPLFLPSLLLHFPSSFFLFDVCVHVCVYVHMCAHTECREEHVLFLGRLSTSVRGSLSLIPRSTPISASPVLGLQVYTHNCKTLWHFYLGVEFKIGHLSILSFFLMSSREAIG